MYQASTNVISYQTFIKDSDRFQTEYRCSYQSPCKVSEREESEKDTDQFGDQTTNFAPKSPETEETQAQDDGIPISVDRLLPTSYLGTMRHYMPPELTGTYGRPTT